MFWQTSMFLGVCCRIRSIIAVILISICVRLKFYNNTNNKNQISPGIYRYVTIPAIWTSESEKVREESHFLNSSPEVKGFTSKYVCIFSHKSTQPDVTLKQMWEVDLNILIQDDREISFKRHLCWVDARLDLTQIKGHAKATLLKG